MVSNQTSPQGHAGIRATYTRMASAREIASFRYLTPAATAAAHGHEASLIELLEVAQTVRPNVILVTTPSSFGHDPQWVKRLLRACGSPTILYWEDDAWHRWAKPPNRSMHAWLAVADVVFTSARRPHTSLFGRRGAGDVRLMPSTYCHVLFEEAERSVTDTRSALSYDAVLIGRRLARWGRISRLPGAVSRAKLVRKLQRNRALRVAIYGAGWSGPGAKGVLPFAEQPRAIREGLMSVNWDHFPRHESYASNRLAISLLAGRVHVTTAHPNFDWVPSEKEGLFLEPTVSALVKRVLEITAAPVEEVLELGAAAHEWVCGRLSDREAARFMLAAIDKRLLTSLPADPWLRLAGEWPQ